MATAYDEWKTSEPDEEEVPDMFREQAAQQIADEMDELIEERAWKLYEKFKADSEDARAESACMRREGY